jgi:hypothetical protein
MSRYIQNTVNVNSASLSHISYHEWCRTDVDSGEDAEQVEEEADQTGRRGFLAQVGTTRTLATPSLSLLTPLALSHGRSQ